MEKSYRFYLKPLDSEADESIGLFLADNGIPKEESHHAYIIVDGKKVFGVYEMAHEYLTQVQRSRFAARVHAYVQEGEGKKRRYALFKRTRTSRSAAGQQAQQFVDRAKKRT